MGIGTQVRHRLGRFEEPAAEAYRRAFISLDDVIVRLRNTGVAGTPPARILEIGCGDGSLAQRLTAAFPDAYYLGIDPAATVGRLYRGRPDAVFRTMTSHDLLQENPEPFDLVVIVDVLHHIPGAVRPSVLRDAAAMTGPAGRILVKEWKEGRPVIGQLAYWADRYVTGDKDVDFMTERQLDMLLADHLPEFTLESRQHVRPWRENVFLTLTRS